MSGEYGEIQRDLGKLLAGQDSLTAYIKSVSTRLEGHITDPNAHPAAAVADKTNIREWIAVIIAVVALLVAFRQNNKGEPYDPPSRYPSGVHRSLDRDNP